MLEFFVSFAIAFVDSLMENVPAWPERVSHGDDYKKTA